MSTETPSETTFTGPRRVFQRLNEKSLRDDLVFYFAIVAVASVLFMALPLLTGKEPEIDGLHRLWFIAAGTLITSPSASSSTSSCSSSTSTASSSRR